MNEERWLPVVGSSNYDVSNLGRVRSKRRVVRCGRVERVVAERILRAWCCKQTGYLQACIDRKKRNVHSLVLEAFVGRRPDGMQCAHGDGVRSNARLDNLRWDTPAGNLADRVVHGTAPRGNRNKRAKLTEAQVRAIRADSRRRVDVARDYSITPEAVSAIVTRKNWNWLP